jgi:hypothetical protein
MDTLKDAIGLFVSARFIHLLHNMSFCDYILHSWKLVSKYCMIGSGDKLLNREIFKALAGARILIEGRRKEYNQERPHSALKYRLSAAEAIVLIGLT